MKDPAPTRRLVAFVLLGVLASAGPAVWARFGGVRPPDGGPSSALAFGGAVVDFGTAFAGEVVERSYPFRNRSDQPVRILSAAASCGCVRAVPSARRIEAGGAGEVAVRFVTDGRFGPQVLRVRVRTDEGPGAGALLTLRGTVRAVLRPRPPRVFLRDAEPGTRHTESIDVDVLEAVDEVALATKGEGVAAEFVTGDARRLRVRIAVDVPARPGARFGGVTIACRHRATGRALSAWIPVVCVVPDPFVVEPGEVRLRDAHAELRVRPRWPGRVALGEVEVGALPLDVVRSDAADGAVLFLTRRGAAWEVPVGASVRLRAVPPVFGFVDVPVLAGDDE